MRGWWRLGVPLLLGACFGNPEPTPAPPSTCVSITTECTPAYDPTYANVFSRTLQPSCGKAGVSCHAEGRQGNLGFVDADDAHRAMIEDTGAVVPGDAACSRLVARLITDDGNLRMPPGRPLADDEICAVVQWIERGASR